MGVTEIWDGMGPARDGTSAGHPVPSHLLKPVTFKSECTKISHMASACSFIPHTMGTVEVVQ